MLRVKKDSHKLEQPPEIHYKESLSSTLEIEIQTFEVLRQILGDIDDHNPFASHRLKFNIILFITDGEDGIHEIDFEKHHYKKGEIILISKEQIHAFIDLPYKNEGYFIAFTEKLFLEISASYPFLINQLYNPQLYSPILSLNSEKFCELKALISKINDKIDNKVNSVWTEIVKSYFKILLLELFNNRDGKNDTISKSPYLEEFIKLQSLLKDHLSEEKKVKFYAEKLNITSKQLNVITQSTVNSSAKDFILALVILEAKRHLKDTKLSSKEIAYKLGFDEPTNFTKFFKKHTQMLPSEFAKRN